MEPYLWIGAKWRTLVVILTFLANVALMATLSNFVPPGGWRAFELPLLFPPPADLNLWTPAERAAVCNGLALDYLFMAVYPLGLSLLCSITAMAHAMPGWLARRLHGAAQWIWIAAPFDALENAGLLAMLLLPSGRTDELNLFVTIVSAVKWLVFIAALILLLIGGLFALKGVFAAGKTR